MERTEIERKVADAVSAAFGVKASTVQAESFKVSATGVFSSYALLELIIRLEEAFKVEIPDDHLEPDRFDTVGSIADYVEGRIAA